MKWRYVSEEPSGWVRDDGVAVRRREQKTGGYAIFMPDGSTAPGFYREYWQATEAADKNIRSPT